MSGPTTWIAFLRAINLGARRKFPKAEIVAATEAAGGTDVATYINTGNVLLTTDLTERAEVEAALEAAYEERAGFAVPTVAFRPAELAAIAEDAAGLSFEGRHYVSLLKEEPEPDAVAALLERVVEPERVHVAGRAAHLLIPADLEASRLENAVVEKHLGVATNRNLNVIRTLAQKWCS